MSNHLSNENSPYLLQHADNPVDWFPWGSEAFEKARRENKPIFLSVGYSTCHWCHVMAHESFENEDIAKILNENFISIKVDREERPDVDSVYMSVCQAFTGSGGWPMSVFMTPQQKPFYAGTYFPPQPRQGMAGFSDLLLWIAKLWDADQAGCLESSEDITARISASESRKGDAGSDGGDGIDAHLPELAVRLFRESFDSSCGGFGGAPKFPIPHNLLFLILYAKLKDPGTLAMAEKTLEQMRRGGLFDHIGYGFSRYSTDRYYLVPHFEKMLYDNALLMLAYAAAYRASGNALFLDTAEKTAAYVLREMRGPGGAFYSAQDADSEGEEGRFYVFGCEEVMRVLGQERGQAFCERYGITKQGNFGGKSIPNLLWGNETDDAFEEQRKMLYAYRKDRAALHLDDKILTAWNALMICALSVLYRVSGRKMYLAAAKDACRFIEENLCEGTALFVSCRDGRRSARGFLDDYAYYTAALLTLYEAAGDAGYLERAEAVCREAQRQFADADGGGYFLCGTENDRLIVRPKETYDGALPSGNAVMAYALVRLSQLTDKEEYDVLAKRQLAFLSGEARHDPAGHSMFLISLLYYLHPPMRITVLLPRAGECENDESGCAGDIPARLPLYAQVHILEEETGEYRRLNGKTTYFICHGHKCLPPTNDPAVLEHL